MITPIKNIDTVTLSRSDTVVATEHSVDTVVVGSKISNTVVVGTGIAAIPQKLVHNQDVDVSNLQDGSVLVYSTNSLKWTATNLLDKQIIEAGQF